MNVHFTRRPPGHDWTDAELETVKRLMAEGRSFAQIAIELGIGISRNAVIGKARRMGFGQGNRPAFARARINRGAQTSAQLTARKKAVKDKIKAVTLVPADLGLPALRDEPFRPGKPLITMVDDIAGIPFLEAAANPHVCRWPLWAGEKIGNCCGAPPITGKPYCEVHTRRAGGA